jgi:hypothetical protein
LRSASLTVGASPTPASVSLAATALPSLGLLAGGLGGAGTLNGTGAAVRFYAPRSIASDGAGNLYVGDDNAIRKIDAAGTVTTFAGVQGQPGSADGTGAAARFNWPRGLTSDGAGNLYVSDGNALRKVVIATGAVTTIAGVSGQSGSADGTGAAARFYSPSGLTTDGAGNLFVADGGNSTIRKVVLATGAVTTFAGLAGRFDSADGTGAAARFSSPGGIASDGAGNLYVTDGGNRTVRRVVIATRNVTTLAGMPGPDSSVDGTGTYARFNGPGGIVSDGAGNLYSTDTNSNGGAIRMLVIATATVTTVVGMVGQGGNVDGVGADARLGGPSDLASDGAGNLFVTDYINATIRKVTTATAAVTTLAGAPDRSGLADGTGAAARFRTARDLTSDGAGNLYVADTYNNAIRKVTIATGLVTTLAGGMPGGSAADGTGAAAHFYEPYAIAADGTDNVYVGDGSRLIRRVVTASRAVTTLAGDLNDPYPGYDDGVGAAARFSGVTGVAADGTGNLFVADNAKTIRKIVIATATVTTFAGAAGQDGSTDGTGAAARFHQPAAIVADGTGNLFVSDNNTIRKIVIATAAVTTLAGAAGQQELADGTGASARFYRPAGVASDGAGTLFVSDNHTIRKVVIATGAVSTIIGLPDRTGITLGALPASLNGPGGVVVLPTGELAIVDTTENAVLLGHL